MASWLAPLLVFLRDLVLSFFKQKQDATSVQQQNAQQTVINQAQQTSDLQQQNAVLKSQVNEEKTHDQTQQEVAGLDDADLFKRLRDQ